MADNRFAIAERGGVRVGVDERLARERDRLAELLPGGSIDRPLEVASASVIEGRARDSIPCPQCGGQYRVLEHTRPIPQRRRIDVACRHCSAQRTLWFRIVPDDVN